MFTRQTNGGHGRFARRGGEKRREEERKGNSTKFRLVAYFMHKGISVSSGVVGVRRSPELRRRQCNQVRRILPVST
ncbi:hypothetical protein E2C01_070085 [Portunus trituberculatus]|uniref:Uncharacterized protein n=1 Tax=Portunus trituberculatus TaxID=210409 RepID=A0A5B7HWD1_PORTR|nr:hypothetical protein [Portunus trituberculatus]